jgi:anti-sigma factor RsiW
MAHVDDGTLNALLDGELDGTEAAGVRAHLSGCTECAARFQDARRFLDEAAELLGVLAPAAPESRPADARPAEPPASPRPGPAGVAPLVPVAPAGPAASGEPPRRISKTAREIAVDIDGGTHKSPAIAPNFPRAGEPLPAPEPYFSRREVRPLNRPAYRRPDWATLAWAASVVLALGVGYLANEVKRDRATLASGEAAAAAADSVPAQATQLATVTRAASPPAEPKDLGSMAVRGTLGPRPAAARGPKPPRQAAADAMTLAAVPAEAAGITTNAPAAELAAARSAPSPAAAAPGAGGVLGARAQPRAAEPTFRSTNVDEAEARLSGTLRTVEGLALENVKIGPGSLVPGAVPTRDVVRLVYTEPSGRRLQLDQQRLPQGRDTSRLARARAVPPTLGLGYGDTLVTAGPAGEARVRWLDRSGLWLSLIGNMPADSLRALLARIR